MKSVIDLIGQFFYTDMKGKIVYAVQLIRKGVGSLKILNVFFKEEDAMKYIKELTEIADEGDTFECLKRVVR